MPRPDSEDVATHHQVLPQEPKQHHPAMIHHLIIHPLMHPALKCKCVYTLEMQSKNQYW